MRLCFSLAAVALLSASFAAHADTLDFTFGNSSNAFSGSGLLTIGTAEVADEYVVTSVAGEARLTPNGPEVAISSILAPGLFPTATNGGSFPANDNTIFLTNGIGTLSQDGLSFVLTNGAQVNLFNDGPGNDAFLDNGLTSSEDVPITIEAIASTPEPSSFALLGTGLLTAACVAKRRLA